MTPLKLCLMGFECVNVTMPCCFYGGGHHTTMPDSKLGQCPRLFSHSYLMFLAVLVKKQWESPPPSFNFWDFSLLDQMDKGGPSFCLTIAVGIGPPNLCNLPPTCLILQLCWSKNLYVHYLPYMLPMTGQPGGPGGSFSFFLVISL